MAQRDLALLPARVEADVDRRAVVPFDAHRLLRYSRPHRQLRVEPLRALFRIVEGGEELLHRHGDGLALVDPPRSAPLLPARARAANPLVSDGHRLRPPARRPVLLENVPRQIAVRHLLAAIVVERLDPALPRVAGGLLDLLVAHAGELGVIRLLFDFLD